MGRALSTVHSGFALSELCKGASGIVELYLSFRGKVQPRVQQSLLRHIWFNENCVEVQHVDVFFPIDAMDSSAHVSPEGQGTHRYVVKSHVDVQARNSGISGSPEVWTFLVATYDSSGLTGSVLFNFRQCSEVCPLALSEYLEALQDNWEQRMRGVEMLTKKAAKAAEKVAHTVSALCEACQSDDGFDIVQSMIRNNDKEG